MISFLSSFYLSVYLCIVWVTGSATYIPQTILLTKSRQATKCKCIKQFSHSSIAIYMHVHVAYIPHWLTLYSYCVSPLGIFQAHISYNTSKASKQCFYLYNQMKHKQIKCKQICYKLHKIALQLYKDCMYVHAKAANGDVKKTGLMIEAASLNILYLNVLEDTSVA